MDGYRIDDLTAEEVEAERELYGPFTQAIRELVDVGIRTTVAADEVRRAQAEIEAITGRLRAQQIEGTYGVRFRPDGRGRAWGNAVVGLRNASAPPLTVVKEGRGVRSDFHLGAAYEGPPGHVHGGIAALILDHALGGAASAPDKPRLTGTITMRYRRMTALGDLHVEAAVVRTEGVKTFAEGRLCDAEGVTVEAEGVFIRPRWARD